MTEHEKALLAGDRPATSLTMRVSFYLVLVPLCGGGALSAIASKLTDAPQSATLVPSMLVAAAAGIAMFIRLRPRVVGSSREQRRAIDESNVVVQTIIVDGAWGAELYDAGEFDTFVVQDSEGQHFFLGMGDIDTGKALPLRRELTVEFIPYVGYLLAAESHGELVRVERAGDLAERVDVVPPSATFAHLASWSSPANAPV